MSALPSTVIDGRMVQWREATLLVFGEGSLEVGRVLAAKPLAQLLWPGSRMRLERCENALFASPVSISDDRNLRFRLSHLVYCMDCQFPDERESGDYKCIASSPIELAAVLPARTYCAPPSGAYAHESPNGFFKSVSPDSIKTIIAPYTPSLYDRIRILERALAPF